jgi:hypothetical protein
MGNNPISKVDPNGGEDGDNPRPGFFSRFVSSVKNWFRDAIMPFRSNDAPKNFEDVSSRQQEKIESNLQKNYVLNTVAQTETTPYVSLSVGKQSAEVLQYAGISLNGSVTFTKYGVYFSPGIDATVSPFNGGLPSLSLSGGFIIGRNLQQDIPGLGFGGSAGSILGTEFSRSYDIGTGSWGSSQFGYVLSTSTVWGSGSAQYGFPVYTNNGFFKP